MVLAHALAAWKRRFFTLFFDTLYWTNSFPPFSYFT
jgi:hypothetical protein